MRAAAGLLLSVLVLASGAEAKRDTVLGIVWQGAPGGRLTWLDALSLKPVGPSLAVGHGSSALRGRSPDGGTLLLTNRGRLRFVDPSRMRLQGSLAIGDGYVSAAAWPRPRRLLVALEGDRSSVLVVDPETPRVVDRRPLEGAVTGAARTPSGLVVLLGPRGRVGPTRLAVVDATGNVQSVRLARVQSGFRRGLQQTPGLAVEPSGARAVVVTPTNVAAEVDLASLTVTYRSLALRRPSATQKLIRGAFRAALWVGNRIVVTGSDLRPFVDDDGRPQQRELRAGVALVSMRDWTSRLLNPDAGAASLVGRTLLVYGGNIGLRGYGPDGRERFHLLGNELVGYIRTSGRYAYVGSHNSRRFRIVDVNNGRVAASIWTKRQTIVLAER